MTVPIQNQQTLPSAGAAREALREKGQFWTPLWLAKVMAAWVTGLKPPQLFDPAVGPGTFFAAARDVGYQGDFAGYEVDHASVLEGKYLNLEPSDFYQVVLGDFIETEQEPSFSAIISNPPYIRHHRLSENRKAQLGTIAQEVLGFTLDGRVGLHVYFLLKCLELLSEGGRLAFLLPADVCEGVSSRALWYRLCERFYLEAVLTFDKSAAPFPQVDTNAIVFLISNNEPKKIMRWIRVLERDELALRRLLQDGKNAKARSSAYICRERPLSEALRTGLSRSVRTSSSHGISLTRLARVVRGIASGANDFFFLTERQIDELELDSRCFVRAIGRTRDCRAEKMTHKILNELEMKGRPSWLLSLDHSLKETLSPPMRAYLEWGESQGFHERALIKSRRPWYKMERREPPPILFAYLGRRDCRFILNEVGVVPLTGFLCVYPHDSRPEEIEKLWRALNHPATLANLAFVGKSYGGGAIKVEPRQLEALEIPSFVLSETHTLPLKAPAITPPFPQFAES